MQRALEEEWLDVLPPDDARARRSRADLRRVNFLMGNARHIARALRLALRPPGHFRIADLGAGDGTLIRKATSGLGEVELTLIDRAPVPDPSVRAQVVAEDARGFLERPGPAFDAIVANLFLHHFEDEPLGRLLAAVAQRARVFVACEPLRARLPLYGSRLLWLLGCNDVTRHDAVASVRAGFRDGEISRLWPQAHGWRLRERPAAPFSHLFVATRDAL